VPPITAWRDWWNYPLPPWLTHPERYGYIPPLETTGGPAAGERREP
jgi:hypothetical protein